LDLAESATANTRDLEQSGAVSGRLAQERHSNREVAKAAFATAVEESKFEMSQSAEKSLAAKEHAERLLAVSCRRLEALGGDCSEVDRGADSALSELVVRAPFD